MVSINELEIRQDVPLVIADGNGFIQKINPKFEKVFHWRQRDLVGRLLTAIIPGRLRDAHHLGFSRFMTTEKPTLLNEPLELEILLGNGEERPARHFIVAEKIAGEWVFGAVIEPNP